MQEKNSVKTKEEKQVKNERKTGKAKYEFAEYEIE